MNILITGGAGYIGSITARRLRDRGDDIIVLDRAEPGYLTRLLPELTFIRGDIRDAGLVRAVLKDRRIDAVVHLAAEKSVEASMHDPGPTFSTNVGGTVTLAEELTRAGIDRIVFSSTCAVYGTPSASPVSESAEVRPENPYGESKWMAERVLDWFARSRGLRPAHLRYFNAAGAWPDGSMGEDWTSAPNLIPAVLRAAWTGAVVDVFGDDYPTPDGTALRDYVHVLDIADAHLRALDHLAGGGDPIRVNLGTGRAASVREVIEGAREVTGRPIETAMRPRRAGDPAAVWADPGEAGRRLGWTAQRALPEMLTSAWRWHVGHPGSLPDGGPRDESVVAPAAAPA